MTNPMDAGEVKKVAALGNGATRGIFHVPLAVATTPKTGPCLCDHWWSVHPEKGLAFWAQLTGYARSEEPSPQCNRSESTARLLTAKLHPGHEVVFLPVVYLAHAQQAMTTVRNHLKGSNNGTE